MFDKSQWVYKLSNEFSPVGLRQVLPARVTKSAAYTEKLILSLILIVAFSYSQVYSIYFTTR